MKSTILTLTLAFYRSMIFFSNIILSLARILEIPDDIVTDVGWPLATEMSGDMAIGGKERQRTHYEFQTKLLLND